MSDDRYELGDFNVQIRAEQAEARLRAIERERKQESRDLERAELIALVDAVDARVTELAAIKSDAQQLRLGAVAKAQEATAAVANLRREVTNLGLRVTSLERHTGIKPATPASQVVTESGVFPVPLTETGSHPAQPIPGRPGAVPPAAAIPAGIVGGLFVIYLMLKELSALFGVLK